MLSQALEPKLMHQNPIHKHQQLATYSLAPQKVVKICSLPKSKRLSNLKNKRKIVIRTSGLDSKGIKDMVNDITDFFNEQRIRLIFLSTSKAKTGDDKQEKRQTQATSLYSSTNHKHFNWEKLCNFTNFLVISSAKN